MLANNTPSDLLAANVRVRTRSLVGVFLLIAGLGVYVFFTRSWLAELSVLSTQIREKENTVATLAKEVADFRVAERSLGKGGEVEKLTLLSAVPVGVNQDDLLRDLVRIAKKHGVELGTVSFAKAGGVEGVGVLSVSSTFKGGYRDLLDFLRSVEANKRKIRVNNISVQLDTADTEGFEKVVFALSMEAYYQLVK